MNTPKECPGKDWYEKIPIILKEELQRCFGERELKKRIDAVTREQIESMSSAKKQLTEAENKSEAVRSDKVLSFTADYKMDLLLKEISSESSEDLKKLVNHLPKGEGKLVPRDHKLLKYCRRVADSVKDVQEAIATYTTAKEAVEDLMDKLGQDQKNNKAGRNTAADAEEAEWSRVKVLGIVAACGLACLVFVTLPLSAPFAVPVLTSFGLIPTISLPTIQGIAALLFAGSTIGAVWEREYAYDYRRSKQGCDERLKEVELKQQQHGEDLRKGLVGCNLSSLERFVIKMKCKLKVLKRSVENDDYDISHVMKKLESFMAVADSYRPTDEDVGQVRS
eukprot:scpid96188/ scgid31516/ 